MTETRTSPQGGSIDLGELFTGVLQTLNENRDQLNQLDGYNGNHGDNMVQIFKVAADALSKKKSLPADQSLAYAAQQLKELPSGSAQVYASGFENAANTFQGREIGPNEISMLLTSLLNLSNIPALQQQEAQPQVDPIASLLGSLAKTQPLQEEEQDIDVGSILLKGGLAFLQARESGEDDLSAGLQALISASPLGEVSHRKQSASLVTEGILSILPQLLGD